MRNNSKIVVTAAKVIKEFCDRTSCDECPFVYYTDDQVMGQWCKLVDEEIPPKDWRIDNGEL